jgi:hypothetical protein
MDDFGKISSIESLPLPYGRHVKDFDAAQTAVRKAARAAKKPVPPSAVTRQMSRNLVVPLSVAPPMFKSVADFVDAYTTTDKTIADVTAEFVVKAGEAKQKQDDILPQLAYMQSILSKKGANHNLVIEARKQGNKIAWWTEYYESYSDKLWQSLRTMERRIAEYRKDPSLPPLPPPDPVAQLRKSDRKALIDAAAIGAEIVTALEQGGDPTPFVSQYKQVVTRKRLDDILYVDEAESEADRYSDTLSRVIQNHRNHINALANQLAAIVIHNKSDDATAGLAQQIIDLYKQSLQPNFFEMKAKQEIAPKALLSAPKGNIRR